MICEVLQRFDPAHEVYWDVCHEWDEEIAKYFGVPVRKIIVGSPNHPAQSSDTKPAKTSTSKKIIGLIKKIPGVRDLATGVRDLARYAMPPLHQNINEPLSLGIAMFPVTTGFMRGANCIPVFLDIWTKADFASVMRQTKSFKLFYVTSRDAYNIIKAKDPSSSVQYMPLSVADKYHSENFAAYRDKFIDVFMPGRGNPVLHKYMLRYAAEHPNIKYVIRNENRTPGNWQCSSTDGSITLPLNTREEYIHVLSSAKVSLVGCSGIDNARPDSNGICFVTPRFYESAVLGCALLGRYPDNEEFTELNMRKYCPNITSYEQFCDELERALAQTPEELYAKNRDFIINSLTSKRAEQIQRDLASLS